MMEQKILDLIDNKTPDGVLTLGVLRRNKIAFDDETLRAINSLLIKGALVRRDSYSFSAERPGNERSKWGMQKNFDQYIHLTQAELEKRINACADKRGLKIIILDDVGSCINSEFVQSEADGAAYFTKYYEAPFSYCFVRV